VRLTGGPQASVRRKGRGKAGGFCWAGDDSWAARGNEDWSAWSGGLEPKLDRLAFRNRFSFGLNLNWDQFWQHTSSDKKFLIFVKIYTYGKSFKFLVCYKTCTT
jgi:hypothetical protein